MAVFHYGGNFHATLRIVISKHAFCALSSDLPISHHEIRLYKDARESAIQLATILLHDEFLAKFDMAWYIVEFPTSDIFFFNSKGVGGGHAYKPLSETQKEAFLRWFKRATTQN